jgi:hypothetical protein
MGPESAVTHIPDDPIAGDHMVEYGHDEKPVFLGHYWMEGDPEPLAANMSRFQRCQARRQISGLPMERGNGHTTGGLCLVRAL